MAPQDSERRRRGESSSRPTSHPHRKRRSESRDQGHGHGHGHRHSSRGVGTDSTSDETRRHSRRSRSASQGLSAEALARLNNEQTRRQSRRQSESRAQRPRRRDYDNYEELDQRGTPERPKKHRYEEVDQEGTPERPRRDHRKSSNNRRVVSGAVLEEGRGTKRGSKGLRGGGRSTEDSVEKEKDEYYYRPKKEKKKKRKRLWIIIAIAVILLIIIIAVAVVVSRNNASSSSSSGSSGSGLGSIDRNSIPQKWQNTYLDPFTWADTKDFNVTFTDAMVGDLPVMGLFTAWDDSARANEHVPPLNQPWGSYSSRPARGVNVGGWLSLEPFITPSLFNYDSNLGIIDEWTLCKHLGPQQTASILEKHYSSFVTEATFAAIAAAGLDHVRIPFSYWAVAVYDDDPYLFRTSWRYLLRSIEWARKHGLRVNLDIHGIPGSQNGWNHSGRQGAIQWLNGPNGQTHAQRALDVHDRLSKFFGQDRYKNIIAFYGLANEPRMTYLEISEVISWTASAYKTIRANGVNAVVVIGDGFMGLDNWRGVLSGYGDGLALDVHQYVIFNTAQIVFTHQEKVQYACQGWTQQAQESMNTATGFGPTLFAEWSQADTDCTKYLTNVGWGNRWTGTYNTGNASTSILTPRCPTEDNQCSCAKANEDPSKWSGPYKQFLKMFAEAQMESFEHGWGWWYWTWDTESAPQWSYRAGLAAGVLPQKAWDRDFNCGQSVPSFDGLPEYY